MQKFLRIFSVIALLAIVGYALTITGSPAHTRMVNEDMDTLEELANLHDALIAYRYRHGYALQSLDAKTLNSLENGAYGNNDCGNYYSNKHYEDEYLKRYEYSATPNGYKICAKFNTDWQEITLNQHLYGNRYHWAENLTKGHYCFERNFPECKKRN